MTLNEAIEKLDKETLVIIVKRIAHEFPSIEDQLIRIMNHEE